MIKRALDIRFGEAVLEGRKITTIRSKPWPVHRGIMLYHWSGAAYRSKHRDVAAVFVLRAVQIRVCHRPGGEMVYETELLLPRELWSTEGFGSQEEMDAWFRAVVAEGECSDRWLMLFQVSWRWE